MPGRLENKTAIVTGAAQGIGAAIAEVFASEGANLILFDIKMDQLKELANNLSEQYKCSVLPLCVDISIKHNVEEAIGLCIEKYHTIDILVNNAGVNVFGKPLDLKKMDWDRSLSINLEGSWNCCQALLPHMINNRYGNVVNVASVHGHKVVRGALPYAVAKHGLVGMTRVLGVEYAAEGIRVNSISPGLIDTPIAEAYFDSCENPEAERQRQLDLLPCKRLGEPRDVANTALFLASDEARFINATDVLIDGGRSQVYCD